MHWLPVPIQIARLHYGSFAQGHGNSAMRRLQSSTWMGMSRRSGTRCSPSPEVPQTIMLDELGAVRFCRDLSGLCSQGHVLPGAETMRLYTRFVGTESVILTVSPPDGFQPDVAGNQESGVGNRKLRARPHLCYALIQIISSTRYCAPWT
jgi:hypothetical protein